MLLRHLTRNAEDEGFTLLELLVVIVVIGILAAIAIPLFLDQRKLAADASVKADVRNTATAVASLLIVDGTPGVAESGVAVGGPPITKSGTFFDANPAASRVTVSTNDTIKIELDPDGSFTVYGYRTQADGQRYVSLPTAYIFDSRTGRYSNGADQLVFGGGAGPSTTTSATPTTTPTVSATPTATATPTPAAPNMISIWDTSLPNCSTIVMPVGSPGAGTIDWGDGKNTAISTYATHTYTDTPGLHTVSISGTFGAWNQNGGPNNVLSSVFTGCLISVTKWVNTGTTDLTLAFYHDSNLTNVTEIPTTTTTLFGALEDASNFNGSVAGWDTSNVTSLYATFSGAAKFNQSVSSWNTSNVTDMRSTFNASTAFNQPLSSWNTSKTTNMDSMFNAATSFNQPLNGWDVSQVTNMTSMFSVAVLFNQPLDAWNTSRVTTMNNMFLNASKFDQNIHGWAVAQAPTHVNFSSNSALRSGYQPVFPN